mmetsp:Transcript_3330/g.5885  ORF Transcript_3330/g.5885 Transcript_3330/m.5885 type:complete len:274 (+) Transcript_3330:601-1422(+)
MNTLEVVRLIACLDSFSPSAILGVAFFVFFLRGGPRVVKGADQLCWLNFAVPAATVKAAFLALFPLIFIGILVFQTFALVQCACSHAKTTLRTSTAKIFLAEWNICHQLEVVIVKDAGGSIPHTTITETPQSLFPLDGMYGERCSSLWMNREAAACGRQFASPTWWCNKLFFQRGKYLVLIFTPGPNFDSIETRSTRLNLANSMSSHQGDMIPCIEAKALEDIRKTLGIVDIRERRRHAQSWHLREFCFDCRVEVLYEWCDNALATITFLMTP